jgi:hypothetical protein
MQARYRSCTGHFPQVRPTVAKPSGDHIAFGCFVYRQSHAQRRYAALPDDRKLFDCDCARYDRLAPAHRLGSHVNLLDQIPAAWAVADSP